MNRENDDAARGEPRGAESAHDETLVADGILPRDGAAGNIGVALFRAVTSGKVEFLKLNFEQLVARIRDAREYQYKHDCPLIKLARFGSVPSAKGSLRHDANVLEIFGVEGDYDAGEHSIGVAQRALQAAGVQAVLYTTASHKDDSPRWRVLAPLSRSYPPSERRRFAAQLNGVLAGVLARESFALSQAYFVGRVAGVAYEVAVSEGRPLDRIESLREIYPSANGQDRIPELDRRTDAELRTKFIEGDGRQEAMLKLSARWAARGMALDDIESSLIALLESGPTTRNAEGDDLRVKVPGMARRAVEKFGETRPEKEAALAAAFDPTHAGIAFRGEAPAAPEFIVENLLPFGTVGGLVGVGGAGKTTFAMWLAVNIALRRAIFDRAVLKPGAALFITAEDDRKTFAHRFWQMAEGMGLDETERELLEQYIFVEDVTGQMLRLVEVDRDRSGNLTATEMGDRLIETYSNRNVRLVFIDPTNLFGPGERYVNDAEAALMTEGQRIARKLGATVCFLHHVAKHVARGDIADQYAGRGGAAFADNSRFQYLLVPHVESEDADDAEDGDEKKHKAKPTPFPLPQLQDAGENFDLQKAAAEGRVLRLHIAKLSWARRPAAPLWVKREDFQFRWVRTDDVLPKDERQKRRELERDRREVEEQRRVVEYVRQKLAEGVRLSVTQLHDEHYTELKLLRPQARKIVHTLLARGYLKRAPLPEDERVGRRKDHLVLGDKPLPEGAF